MAHKRFQNSQNIHEMTSKDELHLCANLQITQHPPPKKKLELKSPFSIRTLLSFSRDLLMRKGKR